MSETTRAQLKDINLKLKYNIKTNIKDISFRKLESKILNSERACNFLFLNTNLGVQPNK